jgi:hypothetical protein
MASSPLELDVKRQRLLQTTAWLAATAALLGVFALYTQPDFLVVLANQVWACF